MPSVLWGVLLIALFSLVGIGMLIIPSLLGGVPERYRPAAVAIFQGLVFTGSAASSYFAVRRSHEEWMQGAWLGLTLLAALGSLQRIRSALRRPDTQPPGGASA